MNTELEVAWSGALETRGEARGLSSYEGRSSLHHSASWALAEAREAASVDLPGPGRPRVIGRCRRPRVVATRAASRQWPPLTGERRAEVLRMLIGGVSYRAIARALDCEVTQIRRVGRDHGIDRSMLAGGRRPEAQS